MNATPRFTPEEAAAATWAADPRRLTEEIALALAGLLPQGSEDEAVQAA